jgi:xylan 1,4-beta-xylosidase
MMEDIKAGLEIINKYPELLNCNILVDECDPDVGTIYGVYDNPNFIHRNTEYYPVFLCSMVKKILELNKKYQKGVDLITSWAFYFEGKRFFEGNRTLFTNENIEKPIVNAFRMLSKLGDTQILLESSGASDPLSEDWEYDIDGIATIKDDNSIQIMIWNHHDEWWREGTEEINIEILNLPFEDRPFILKEYRIDKEHSNSYTEWVNQGMPQDPSPSQVARIKEKQGLELVGPVRKYLPKNRTFNFRFNLLLHGVSLFELEPIG